MLRLRVNAFVQPHTHASNPATLLQSRGIDLTLTTAIPRNFLRVIAVLAALDAVGACLLWIKDDFAFNGPAFAAAVFASLSLFALRRRPLVRARMHIVPPGAPFPHADSFTVNRAKYILTVRATAPDVARRLRDYNGQAITYTREYQRIVSLMQSNDGPRLFRSPFTSQGMGESSELQSDLWPIARLLVARRLYRPDWAGSTRRDISGKPLPTLTKGDHAAFTFRLHVGSVALWIALLGFVVVIGKLYSVDKVSLAAMFLLWAVFTLGYHRKIQRDWSEWLDDWGNRPLGDMPVFLYWPQNDTGSSWEELDNADFGSAVQEFMLETSNLFQIVVGSLVVVGLTLLQLF